jgi:predicted dehydrogenase
MKIGIIGAGLQAKRRAQALRGFPGARIVAIGAAHIRSAEALASEVGSTPLEGWQSIVERSDLDAVIVCTPPHLHHEISIAAMKSGKHVLCEKPLARTAAEAGAMVKMMRETGLVLKCGFNLRHHPAVALAHESVKNGIVGKPYYSMCRFGIIGRKDYGREWRGQSDLVGGGQLMEQGIHAVDLARWFLGEFVEVACFKNGFYWNLGELEDNAFVTMRTAEGQIATIHASLTQWKNLFSLEVFGSDGYVRVTGLGGAYGTERIHIGKKDFVKPFSEQVIEYRGSDQSWVNEFKEFSRAIEEKREPIGSGADGLVAIQLVEAAYRSAKQKKFASPEY